MRGLTLKPRWVHCDGTSSRTEVLLAAWHNPRSITWRWALYLSVRGGWFDGPVINRTPGGRNSYSLGPFTLATQRNLYRNQGEEQCR